MIKVFNPPPLQIRNSLVKELADFIQLSIPADLD